MVGTVDGMCMALLVVYFLYVSKDWRPWFWIAFVIQFFILVGVIWLPESPEFFFSKGKFEESEQVIHRFAAFNGYILPPNKLAFGHGNE